MSESVPEWRVPVVEGSAGPAALDNAIWDGVPALPTLQLADGSGSPRFATVVRVALSRGRLHVRYDCDDADIWGTYTPRDDPIYEQEAVEVFLAPGPEDPRIYYEFEVSPLICRAFQERSQSCLKAPLIDVTVNRACAGEQPT